jgi:adenine deaminase
VVLSVAGRKALMDVAMGRAPADLAISGGRVANVLSGEIHEADILVKDGLIAALAEPGAPLPEPLARIDARGRILAPGLIDPHMHIESSSVSVAEFARAVVPRGVTTIAIDPHEFGNVVGTSGIRALLDTAAGVPLRVLLRVPARVPELPEAIETPGATITLAETADMLGWPEAVCLAGDINPEIILRQDAEQLWRFEETDRQGRYVSGYVPQIAGPGVDALVAAGVEDSHVPKTVEELLLDVRHGLHVLLTPRPGRFEEADFRKLGILIREGGIDPRRISLCTDDVLVHELITSGHLDARLRIALAAGIPAMTALQMGTRNTAELLRIGRTAGALAAGRAADIVILSDLATWTVDRVVVGGKLVAEGGRMLDPPKAAPWPEEVRHTIRCTVPDAPEGLALAAPTGTARVRCRVLVASHPKTIGERELPVEGGFIRPDPAQDVAAMAVLERYHRTGRIGRGFVTGFGLSRGAVASSINHNSHHIFAVGADFADMRLALSRVIDLQGGYVAACDGAIVGEVPFPVIGMISDLPLERLAADITRFEDVLTGVLGCSVERRPLYALNFICSPVVMNYGVTDRGLVDCRSLSLLDVVLAA